MAALTKDGYAEPAGNITDAIGGNDNYNDFNSRTRITHRREFGGYKSFMGNFFPTEAPTGGSTESWGVLE